MQAKMKIVVITSGSQLLLPIMERIVARPELCLVGIALDRETDRKRAPFVRRLRSVLKYRGPMGLVQALVRKLGATRRAEPGSPVSGGIEKFARDHGIPLHVTGNIHEEHSLAFLRERNADIGLVVGARLLHKSVFQIPRMGCINVHQGIIPDYRGGGSVFWPLFNGEKELGVSVHKVVARVDSGALYVQKRIPLVYDYARHGDSYPSFLREVSPVLDRLAVEAVMEALVGIAQGTIEAKPVNLQKGNRYRRPTWWERRALRRRIRERYGPGKR